MKDKNQISLFLAPEPTVSPPMTNAETSNLAALLTAPDSTIKGPKKKIIRPPATVEKTERQIEEEQEAKTEPIKIVAEKRKARISSMDTIYKNLTIGLKTFFRKNGFDRAVLGVSGGVDSALTLKIAVDALGAKNVTAILMPELGMTKQENIEHAKMLCHFLGVINYYQPINNFLTDFGITPWRPNSVASMNIKARIRSVLLYSYANTARALVLGTSNKSETLLGYGTKYGDMAADVEVIGDLYKTEVVTLADFAGLPPEIVNKTPSAELSVGQTDEEEMGATYSDMDKVLMLLESGLTQTECAERDVPPALLNMVCERMEKNKHKREMPPVIPAH